MACAKALWWGQKAKEKKVGLEGRAHAPQGTGSVEDFSRHSKNSGKPLKNFKVNMTIPAENLLGGQSC